MNKKLYIQPQTKLVSIVLHNIIAESEGPRLINSDEAETGSVDAPVNFARSRGLWNGSDDE